MHCLYLYHLIILILITHPLIFARFDWLRYITWCKITGQFSRNNLRLRRYLTDDYFSRKETEQVVKSQLKSLAFSSFLFKKEEKRKIAVNARYENVGVIK